MLLFRTESLPPFECHASFREARWRHAAAALLLAAASVGCLVMAGASRTLERGALGELALGLGLLGGAACGLGALLCASNLAASLRRGNWLLRYGPEGLLIKFRSYQDAHVPELHPTVALLTNADVARVVLRTYAGGGVGDRRARDRGVCLDVHLARGDATALAEAIATDQCTAPPSRLGLRWRSRHMPVWVPERGVVRLAWHDDVSRVTPSAEHALSRLAATLPVEHESPQPAARVDGRSELDLQLRRMCEEGDTLGALSLARSRYDLSQRDARALLERLAGSH